MNGVRSISMRKGYLLTALAAAVLLAASSGTALAQTTPIGTHSVGFDRNSTSVTEGDTTRANPAAILKIVRTAVPNGEVDTGLEVTLNVGDAMPTGSSDQQLVFAAEGGTVGQIGNDGDAMVVFTGDSTEITLEISIMQDGDWADSTVNLSLDTDDADIGLTRGRATVNVADADPQPVAKFSKASIKLTEDSSTTVEVSVGLARGEMRDAPADLAGISDALVLMLDPPDALDAMGGPPIVITGVTLTEDTMTPGMYTGVGNIGALSGAPAMLTIMATADMVGYKSPTITISFEAKSLEPDEGDISNGGSLVINIESDEPVPTVSFSPTDVYVDEGGSVDTVLIAEGKHGSEVMEVELSIETDGAMVGLYQGMDKLEPNADGNIVVDLGESNSARLTAKSYSDPDLNDGDMKFIAWKIMEADDANIGDGYWFKVVVNGSTAVPALPLLGQLLLALFLMAGGARLYRRRQG